MQKILALDIGTYSIKLALLEIKGDKFILEEPEEVLIPQGSSEKLPELKKEILTQLISKHRGEFDAVFSCFGSQNSVSKNFEYQGVKRKDISKFMLNEFEEVGIFNISDYTVEYSTLYYDEKIRQVIGFLVKKSCIREIIHISEELELGIQIIDHESLALTNLCRFLIREPIKDMTQKQSFLIVDVGHSKTTISLFSGNDKSLNNKLTQIRVIQICGQYMTSKIQKEFNVAFLEAEKLKHNPDTNPNVLNLLTSCYSELSDEILRSLKSFCSKEDKIFEAIYFTGGGIKFKNFESLMERDLKIPCKKITLNKETIDFPENIDFSIFSNCISFGLRGDFNKLNSSLNFRHGELALVGNQQKLIDQILQYSAILAISILLISSAVIFRKIAYDSKINELRKEYKEDIKKTMQNIPSDINKILEKQNFQIQDISKRTIDQMKQEMTVEKKFVTNMMNLKSPFPIKILNEMSANISKSTYFEIVTFYEQDKSLKIDAETDKESNINLIKEALENINILSEVEVRNNGPKAGSGGKTFRILITSTLKTEI